jgi:hypothetical protein
LFSKEEFCALKPSNKDIAKTAFSVLKERLINLAVGVKHLRRSLCTSLMASVLSLVDYAESCKRPKRPWDCELPKGKYTVGIYADGELHAIRGTATFFTWPLLLK